MADKNYYEILGVGRKATEDEIKSAYRKLVKQYHPDLHPNDANAAAKFKEVNEANEVLSDPQKRAAYDYELDHPGCAAAPAAFPVSAAVFPAFPVFRIYSAISFPVSAAERPLRRAPNRAKTSPAKWCSVFSTRRRAVRKRSAIRATNLAKAAAAPARRTAPRTRPAKSAKVRVRSAIRRIPCSEGPSAWRFATPAAAPAKRSPRCVRTARARDIRRKETVVTLNIPAGADTNSYIRKKGYGQASSKGGAPGDLIVIFRVESHKIFKRKERDLYVELPVSLKRRARRQSKSSRHRRNV